MNSIMNLEENKEVMTLIVDGKEYNIKLQGTTEKPYFCGKDVCKVLGYADGKSNNILKTIQNIVKPKHKCMLKEVWNISLTTSDSQTPLVRLGADITNLSYNDGKAIYISEAGLYSLIMHSRVAFAQAFQDLVLENILPSIRKFGIYQTNQQILQIKQQLAIKEAESVEKDKQLAIKEAESVEKDKQLAIKEAELEDSNQYALTLKELMIPQTKRELTEIVYISTSVNYAKQNRFKVGGVESLDKLKGRLAQYNGRSAAGDEWYFSDIFKVASFRECERRVCDALQRFRDKRGKEIYVMHYTNLVEFVKYLIEHYEDEIDDFNENLNLFISNLSTRKLCPVVPNKCPEMSRVVITRVIDGKAANTIIESTNTKDLQQGLQDYMASVPEGTTVTRAQVQTALAVTTNKREFWKWLKTFIPSYPSITVKY